jgi:SAM-dependent methyltransferase
MKVLNLGCGSRRTDFPEYRPEIELVGVDYFARDSVDVVHDLNIFPYPFPDSSFDLIILQDVLEHLMDVPAVLAELHRVGRPGAEIRVRSPHYSSYYAYGDVTHRHYFSSFSFDDFLLPRGNIYAPGAWFALRKRRILFPRIWRLCGISALANRFPARWEQLFAFIFRAENLEFSFEIVKDQ